MMNRSLQNTADEIQKLTYDLVHYYGVCDRVTTREIGVTASQGYILLTIPGDDSISMNDLSIKMRLANSTMTRMVDQLVQKGLVVRETNEQDRRIVLIRQTEKGREVRAKLQDTLQDLFSQVLGDLSDDEREEILRSLEILNRAIIKTLKSCCGSELSG